MPSACAATGDAIGYSKSLSIEVVGATFHGETGDRGKPDWLSLDGKIAADGSLTASGSGLTGDKNQTAGGLAPGTPYTFRVEGHITGTAGSGKRLSPRDCKFAFAKQQAAPTTVADISGTWSTVDGRNIEIKQNGNQVSWTSCCKPGHESLVVSVSGTFDGKTVAGAYHWREGDA